MRYITGLNAFKITFFRDLLLGIRNQSDLINPLIFFIIVVTIFPLTIGPEQETLRQLAPAIIWVAAILSFSLSIDGLFRNDFEDGSLEQMLLAPHSGIILISAKLVAHWVLSGFPLFLIALFSGFILYLPEAAIRILLITLVLGTPVVSLIGAIIGALTMGLRSSGMLQALLVLPLLMPLLIFSVSAVTNAMKGLSVVGEIYFLGAILVLALTFSPLAVLSALRIRLG